MRLLETTKHRVSYLHFDVGTREEFDFYLKKWGQAKVGDTYPILYLGFHGAPGEVTVGEGRHGSITLDDLAERLEGRCRGRVIHFGSCGTAAVHGRELTKFRARTEALAVCGYKEGVDCWSPLRSNALAGAAAGRVLPSGQQPGEVRPRAEGRGVRPVPKARLPDVDPGLNVVPRGGGGE